ncbi:hypothetical protein IW262DRAFT_1454318 [Armillaria fumosa]|nr:hypothetical protein IW262DRAFT_1454318 [Armillaria fumosa]
MLDELWQHLKDVKAGIATEDEEFDPSAVCVLEEVLENLQNGMVRYMHITCFSREHCEAEMGKALGSKLGNLILEGGKLKIKDTEIKALAENTMMVDTWIDAVSRAKTIIKKELNMGDGRNGPVTLHIAEQYVKYFDYWLNYNGLRKIFLVLCKFDQSW